LFLGVVAIGFYVAFVATLRARLDAGGVSSRLTSIAYGAGLVGAAMLFSAVVFWTATALAGHDAVKAGSPLDPSVYRFCNDAGYLGFVGSSMLGGVIAWATAAHALAGRAFPRWFGWVSVVVGVIAMASVEFLPVFLTWLWVLVAGIIMTARPDPALTAPDTAAEIAPPIEV
jgi:hypothetical protein